MWHRRICMVLVLLAWLVFLPVAEAARARHEAVRALSPLGYWPADEGEGRTLHDRSGHENHGRLHHVGWEGELLHFTNAFQWARIASHPAYRDLEAFTLGGWVYTRRETYAAFGHGHGVLVMAKISHWPWHGRYGDDAFGVRLQGELGVEVFSGGRTDVLGSLGNDVSIDVRRWQHLIYTHEQGVGKLYVNGELARSSENVPSRHADMDFYIGADANWWMLYPNDSRSLDGSVRDMVVFDRALSAEEVKDLHDATIPGVEPASLGDEAIVVDHREIGLDELAGLSVDDRQAALEQLRQWDVERLREVGDELVPALFEVLELWQTRQAATALLVKLGTEEARLMLRSRVLPLLVEAVEDEAGSRQERAASALALAEMGQEAGEAVPALVSALEAAVARDGGGLPRIEQMDRNALIRALLETGADEPAARRALGEAFARPMLESLDYASPSLSSVGRLMEAGRYMDALRAYRALPGEDRPDPFFSQGDPRRDARERWGNPRAYTPSSSFDGYRYRIGTGVYPWPEIVERISREEYDEAVAELAEEYPGVGDWRHADGGQLSRIEIVRIDPEGNETRARLQGDWFVFHGGGKRDGWSICVDRDGYIHVVGGKHNHTDPNAYVPGSFERMGLSRDRGDEDFPVMLYWVSREPGSIDDFEFVGQRRNPRNVPVPSGLNYMNFTRDREGELYLYGRITVEGIQSWGFYRYDADERRWSAVGGRASDALTSATSSVPGWSDYLVVRGGDRRWRASDDPEPTVFVWAWQPHFYNYIRGWGVQFDRANRMHVRVPIRALDARGRVVDAEVYAYSDDGGETFHRADGTELALPLTANPGAGKAWLDADYSGTWWGLWASLLSEAGYE